MLARCCQNLSKMEGIKHSLNEWLVITMHSLCVRYQSLSSLIKDSIFTLMTQIVILLYVSVDTAERERDWKRLPDLKARHKLDAPNTKTFGQNKEQTSYNDKRNEGDFDTHQLSIDTRMMYSVLSMESRDKKSIDRTKSSVGSANSKPSSPSSKKQALVLNKVQIQYT